MHFLPHYHPCVFKHWLTDWTAQRKWLATWTQSGAETDMREVLDWDYYKQRLGNSVLKITSIPAVLQGVGNPVERIPLPDWLVRRLQEEACTHKQQSIDAFLTAPKKRLAPPQPAAARKRARTNAGGAPTRERGCICWWCCVVLCCVVLCIAPGTIVRGGRDL
jgi:hypothetical protein